MAQSWRRTRQFCYFIAASAIALLGAGAIYQSISVRREATLFPPPGQLVDIGGRRLHLICLGDGTPTVIFEASGFGNALSSTAARIDISKRVRVCSYDR